MNNNSKSGVMEDTLELIIDSKSENESFARVAVAAFCTRLDPTLEEITDIKTADLRGILIFDAPHDTPNIILSKLLDTLSNRLNNIFNLIPPILYLMNIFLTLSLKLYTNILSIRAIFVDLAKLL